MHRPSRKPRYRGFLGLSLATAATLAPAASTLHADDGFVETTAFVSHDFSDGSRARSNEFIDTRSYDLAMDRLAERLRSRALNPQTSTTRPAVDADEAWPVGAYPKSLVLAIKFKMLRDRDDQLAQRRAALRRRLLAPADVRALSRERSELEGMSPLRLRGLLLEVDARNADRNARFRQSFGELPEAARTTVMVLTKGGMIESATPLPEDPLTVAAEEAHNIRRAYYQFTLPAREGVMNHYTGYVEFIWNEDGGLWLPTWADLRGEPTPLFDAAAFTPLKPYHIAYTGKTFAVTQQNLPAQMPEVFALLLGRDGSVPMFGR